MFSSAVQGPITGGPVDVSPPELINIIPENFSTNISKYQNITLIFNEPVNPAFANHSISIDSNLFQVKVRGKNITIIPMDEWSSSSVIYIYVDRRLQDYQKKLVKKLI